MRNKEILRQYWQKNSVFLILLLTALALGLFIGFCSFDRIGDEAQLQEFLGSFFSQLSQMDHPAEESILRQSVLQTTGISFLLFLSGLSLLGVATAPFVVWYKGFAAGFTAMVFFRLYGLRVFPFLLFGILPSALIWIPFLLLGAQKSMRLSAYLMECCCRPGRQTVRFRALFLGFCAVMAASAGGLFVAGLVETYLTPRLLGLISNLYLS